MKSCLLILPSGAFYVWTVSVVLLMSSSSQTQQDNNPAAAVFATAWQFQPISRVSNQRNRQQRKKHQRLRKWLLIPGGAATRRDSSRTSSSPSSLSQNHVVEEDLIDTDVILVPLKHQLSRQNRANGEQQQLQQQQQQQQQHYIANSITRDEEENERNEATAAGFVVNGKSVNNGSIRGEIMNSNLSHSATPQVQSATATTPMVDTANTPSPTKTTGVVSGLLSRISRRVRGSRNSKKAQQAAAAASLLAQQQLQKEQEFEQLKRDNEKLRLKMHRLELENERLLLVKEKRIILETFEGEGKLRTLQKQQEQMDTMIRQFHVDIAETEQQQKQKQKSLSLPTTSLSSPPTTTPMMEDQVANLVTTISDKIVRANGATSNLVASSTTSSTSTSYVDDDDVLDAEQLWCDELEDGACPIEPTLSFQEALRDRAYWLVGLLVLQSASGIILARNEALLADHPVIIYFLTMLVGAGGNAGNQASVRVIRGLALGTLNENTQTQFLLRELKMAAALSCILSLAGFVRAIAFSTPLSECIAVTSALALIVLSSVCLGAILPLVLKRLGVDPAHSSTTIQVIMDILGVVLAVVVSRFLLDSPIGQMLIVRLTGG